MKVYTILINDRHADTEVNDYKSKESAIKTAKRYVTEWAKYPEDIEETEGKWCLYHGIYSCEGDSVTVSEVEVND